MCSNGIIVHWAIARLIGQDATTGIATVLGTCHYSIGYKSGKVDNLDEGLMLGDYPMLPWRSAQELPARGWWDDQDRRNKEDPVLCNSYCTVARMTVNGDICMEKMARRWV